MGLAQRKYPYLSEENYLEGEEVSEMRHEYLDGQVYAMTGASDSHNLVAGEAFSLLNAQLPNHCQVFMSDLKVRIQLERKAIFYYPDVVVSCAADDRARYFRAKPCLIIEYPCTDATD